MLWWPSVNGGQERKKKQVVKGERTGLVLHWDGFEAGGKRKNHLFCMLYLLPWKPSCSAVYRGKFKYTVLIPQP